MPLPLREPEKRQPGCSASFPASFLRDEHAGAAQARGELGELRLQPVDRRGLVVLARGRPGDHAQVARVDAGADADRIHLHVLARAGELVLDEVRRGHAERQVEEVDRARRAAAGADGRIAVGDEDHDVGLAGGVHRGGEALRVGRRLERRVPVGAARRGGVDVRDRRVQRRRVRGQEQRQRRLLAIVGGAVGVRGRGRGERDHPERGRRAHERVDERLRRVAVLGVRNGRSSPSGRARAACRRRRTRGSSCCRGR